MYFNRQYKYRVLWGMAVVVLGLLAPVPARAIEADASSAVIFAYQHIGDDAAGQSSISLDQFKAHIDELKTEGYHVRPLPEIIAALKSGAALPPQTIALTFDGAWLSTLSNAVPLLTDANMPFTVFFASDMADTGAPNHMTWKQLRTLRKNKLASFGILPAAYVHMAGSPADQNAARINKAIERYRDEMGAAPTFFAYPYGEYSSALKKQLSGYPFVAAFGQQSGVAHAKSDFMALPRFTLTDGFGDLDRFTLTTHALPLPVSDVIPDDMIMTQNPPMIGFTVTSELKDLSRLSCFVSGQGKAQLARLGNNRIEIRLQEKLEDRGTRINCTMPDDKVVAGSPQVWRWFGMELIDLNYNADAPGTEADGPDDADTPAPEAPDAEQ